MIPRRRWTSVLLAIGLAAACRAQEPTPVDAPPALPDPPDTVAEPPPPEPSGPEAPSPEAAATNPAGPTLAKDEFSIQADEVYSEAGAVYARGSVRLQHGEIIVTGDEGEVDEDGVWAQMTGNVVILSKGQRTTGSRLRVNLEDERWELIDGQTKLEPEFVEDRTTEPVYVRAQSIQSDPQRDYLVAQDAAVTTCDHAEKGTPEHYDLTTDECEIRLHRDVVLDHPALYVLGHRIFRYPGKLRLRMNENRSRLIVELGQNSTEGLYVKLGYPYDAGESAAGLVRLHLTSRRGVGVGVEHWFDTGQAAGEIDVFAEPQQAAWSTRVRHRYQFSRALSTTLNTSLQNNSGYSLGSTTSLSSDFTLRNDSGEAHTTLGLQHYLTSGSSFSSSRLTSNLTHQQRGPEGIDWTLRSLFQESRYGTDPAADQELELSFEARRQQDAYDWELGYKQRFDIDGGRYTRDSQYYALDELPTFVARTDTERLGLGMGVPIQTRVELGQFRQQPENRSLQRVSFVSDIYGESIALARHHELRSGAGFRQSFFSDGSAQYDVRTDLTFESEWGGSWYSRVQWDWEQVAGFAPLRLDYGARRHDVQFDFSRYVANRSRVELSTGYDVRDSLWRDLLLRAEFTPNARNRFELQSSYDLQYKEFRPLELRWQFVRQHRLDLDLALSYDIDERELGRVVVDSDWVVSPKWRVESLVGYNGIRQNLDFFETRITRDLHCWIASLAYSFSQQEIRLNIGLKALTRGDWEYGLGNRGQLLTAPRGQYF